ncbi:hypothetical protein L195_g063973, partial [Trifolium pratense]
MASEAILLGNGIPEKSE